MEKIDTDYKQQIKLKNLAKVFKKKRTLRLKINKTFKTPEGIMQYNW